MICNDVYSIRPSFTSRKLPYPKNIKLSSINVDGVMKYCAPGDIIAYEGKSLISSLIKIVTSSKISHPEIMLSNNKFIAPGDPTPFIDDLRSYLEDFSIHNKSAYICKLKPEIRKKLLSQTRKFKDTAKKARKIPYTSTINFIKIGLNRIFGFPKIKENTEELNCASLVGYLLKKMKIIPPDTNISAMTPKDIFELDIYESKIKIEP